ncbi:xanthine dehydrogenase small subunit [Marinobacterium nitratireducens]|uniref:Xanthine dehydrogenase small subunit n=1 Tax=Marinobacterium nitratireducens TaxID=518897 RepID=A0A917ZR25_9GAMM|nr:xanthine dehydrogenase small subunit [Marinobacterium nitratireducens]GGO88327.1 xanthine dehydrogenase small subunit [Marinobacterium nitratireducens]
MIRFLLNQELRVEQDLDPNVTVLNYLREHLGKTGTKEGCASGDCGACTVVVGELEGDRIRYRTLNSCLTFVASLNGKQLITVEGLKDNGQLHSVQQAMVDCHGSQCGFCTPGFVMSMFALQKNGTGYDKAATEEALAGNLCRCTGYRPIIDAAEQSCKAGSQDQFDRQHEATLAQLRKIQPDATCELNGADNRSFTPLTVADLAELYVTHPDARLLAGGTDLALEVTQMHKRLPVMIYVGNVAELKTVDTFDDRIEIGAAVPLTDCYDVLSREYPDFADLLHRFASLQIRNQGTLGGNIGNASPIGDSPPALLALGANIVLRQGNSSRTIALEDYFVDYRVTVQQESEFIEKIIVPRAPTENNFRVYKISKRLDDDISAVCGAFNLQLEDGTVTDARIAFGGMAAIPKRARHCEQALLGKPWDDETLETAVRALAEDFAPISDFRASKEYRLLIAGNLLRKYKMELSAPEQAIRVTAHV